MGLIAGLRWRLFWNSLGTWKAKAELIASVLVGGVAAIVAVAIGLGIGAGAFAAVSRGRWGALAGIFWGLFAFWQLAPFLLAMTNKDADSGSLLRFPLRFSTFFILNLAYGLLDPVAVTAMFWLACLTAGVALARPELGWATCLSVAMFAALSLLLNRLLFAWLMKLLAKRKTRETVFLVFLLGMMSLQLTAMAGAQWAKKTRWNLGEVQAVGRWVVAGAAAGAIENTAAGNTAAAAGAWSALGLCAGGLGLLLRRRLYALYQGEEAGWSSGEAAGMGERTVRPGWRIPWMRAPVAAVAEKEVKYFFRNGPMALQLIVPAFVIGVLALAWRDEVLRPGLIRQSPELMFPSAVAYSLLILMPMIHNCFAYEARGIQAVLLAPVKFRDVLEGKNLVHGGLVLAEGMVIWAMSSAVFLAPGAGITAATFSALVFATLINLTAGNALSLHYPRRFDFGQFQQRQSGMSVLFGLVVQGVTLTVIGVVFAAAHWLGAMWQGAAIFGVLGMAAWQVYTLGLEHCEELAREQRETMLMELCAK